MIKTNRQSHSIHTIRAIDRRKAPYLSDKNNLRNQEDAEARGRLAEKVSVATEKHDGDKCLARASLQVNNRVPLHCFL